LKTTCQSEQPTLGVPNEAKAGVSLEELLSQHEISEWTSCR